MSAVGWLLFVVVAAFAVRRLDVPDGALVGAAVIRQSTAHRAFEAPVVAVF